MSEAAGQPLVSCIMPTRDRRQFVPRAVQLFLDQDYPRRELLVLDDGDDPVAELIPADPRIRYERLPRRAVLGAKRNQACRLAEGELIAHWDDDDWSASWRLSHQVAALLESGADICGLSELYFLDPAAGKAWRYEYPTIGLRPWVAGGTMCYRKDLWRRHRFPEVTAGEDTRFLWSGRPRVLALPDPGIYVATIHPANTSPKRPHGSRWQAVDPAMLAALMAGEQPAAPPESSAPAAAEPAGAQVTISIPYRGCGDYVVQAVRSALAQTHRNLTVVVVNDGDPVPPWDLLAGIDDPRLVCFDLDRNRGRYFADAVVLAATASPYFAPQDADDWTEPDRIATLLRTLRETHSVGVFSGHVEHYPGGQARPVRLDRVRQPVGDRLVHRALHVGLFDADALRALGGYYAGFRVGYDTLLVTLLQMTGPVAFVDQHLYHRRMRAESLTSARATGMASAHRRAVAAKLARLFATARSAHRAYLDGQIDVQELQRRIRELLEQATPAADRQAIQDAAAELAPRLRRAAEAGTAQRRPDPARTERRRPTVQTLLADEALWGGRWSIDRAVAVELAARLARRRPAHILEAGSGASTLLLAAHAAATGARAVALEHDPRYAARTTELLRRAGLQDDVELVSAPLQPLPCPDGRSHPWYGVTPPGPVDFLLIDGPPTRHGRQAALFAVARHLTDGWEAWLHDGDRPGERDCVAVWQRHLGVQATPVPVGRNGLWVLGAVAAPPRLPERTAVALDAGRRPELLQPTVDALELAAPGLLAQAPLVVLDDGAEPALEGSPLVDLRLRRPARCPEGEATSLLLEAARLAQVELILHLGGGWVAATTDAGWLERAAAILRSAPDVGQVRLRHSAERVLDHHMVTRRPLEWRDRGGWLWSPSAHFTFNPSMLRAADLARVLPAASERAAQERFLELRLASAQLLPGVFHHRTAAAPARNVPA